jgi:hypothetical protein
MLHNKKIDAESSPSVSNREGLVSSLITLGSCTTGLTAIVLAQVAIGSLII